LVTVVGSARRRLIIIKNDHAIDICSSLKGRQAAFGFWTKETLSHPSYVQHGCVR